MLCVGTDAPLRDESEVRDGVLQESTARSRPAVTTDIYVSTQKALPYAGSEPNNHPSLGKKKPPCLMGIKVPLNVGKT